MNDHCRGQRPGGRAGALVASMLLLAACTGEPPSSSASPGAGASRASTAPAVQLFAVLEPGGEPSTTNHDTVAIVGMDRVARAQARFAPRQNPRIFSAVPVLQVEARVVAGGVLFADGTGRVRRLVPGGQVTDVASFPIAAQQTLSFAADPSGTRLAAVRITFPPPQGPPPDSGQQPTPGSFTQEVLSAVAGQPAVTLSRTSLGPSPQSGTLAAAGWSANGPLVTTNTAVAVQNHAGGERMYGHLAHLDASGRPGAAIGGSDCSAWAFLPDDTVLCSDARWQTASVRSPTGLPLLSASASPGHVNGYLTLSPDGSRITLLEINQGGPAVIVERTGARTRLPAGFLPQGWLDASTLIGELPGAAGPGNLALLRLTRPDQVLDLGFKGLFVGALTPGG